jgi:uncharacterized integral membrane protein
LRASVVSAEYGSARLVNAKFREIGSRASAPAAASGLYQVLTLLLLLLLVLVLVLVNNAAVAVGVS